MPNDDPLSFSIVGALGEVRIVGSDTTILTMPEHFYVDISGQRTLLGVQFLRWLREYSEGQAANLGERLHHASYWITTDPDLVAEKGNLHDDCERCADAVKLAVERMRIEPKREMIVGQIFWANR